MVTQAVIKCSTTRSGQTPCSTRRLKMLSDGERQPHAVVWWNAQRWDLQTHRLHPWSCRCAECGSGASFSCLCAALCFCALCCSQLSMNGFQGNHREQCGVCVCVCVTLQAKIPISSVRVVQCFPHTGFTSAGWPVPNGCTDIVVFFRCDWLQNKSQENVCVDAYVCECKNCRTRRRRGLKPRPRLHLIFDDSERDLSTDVKAPAQCGPVPCS